MAISVSKRSSLGILGGTFDPVHNGHLQMAQDALSALPLDEVRLIPCYRPAHRDAPVLTAEQRLQLLSLAVGDYSGLAVDDRELRREQLSYTVDTLRSLREERGDHVSLVFILGEDAYAGLTSWHCWQELRELAHLLIMARPQMPAITNPLLQEWLMHRDNFAIVQEQPSGGIMRLSKHMLPISSTQVRQQLMAGAVAADIPLCVQQCITQNHWYQHQSEQKTQ